MSIRDIIFGIITVEGEYSNDPSDSGGATRWGITEKVARANGYTGDMRELPTTVAYDIYYKQYVVLPKFDEVYKVSPQISEELVDTGVNMGISIASKFLQQALNALNDGGTQYSDLVVDGVLGNRSISSLQSFLARRGANGTKVLLIALNSLQCARYISIAESTPKNERFVYGWILNRVSI